MIISSKKLTLANSAEETGKMEEEWEGSFSLFAL